LKTNCSRWNGSWNQLGQTCWKCSKKWMSWNNKRHLHWILPKYEFVKKAVKGRPLGTENAYNREALFEIFKNARKICGDRPLACNILHAINDYARVVNDALEAGAILLLQELDFRWNFQSL